MIIFLIMMITFSTSQDFQQNYWSLIETNHIQNLPKIIKTIDNDIWLESYNYITQKDSQFNIITELNYERIKQNHGYITRPTRNTEIILYIITGTILYKDSRGRIQRLNPTNLMYLSSGFGIYHSEFCLDAPICEYIIAQIKPRRINLEPQFDFYKYQLIYNAWNNIVGDINDYQSRNPIKIDQKINILIAQFNLPIDFYLADAFQIYIICLQGFVQYNEQNTLKKGDLATVKGPILLQFFPEIETMLIILKIDKLM